MFDYIKGIITDIKGKYNMSNVADFNNPFVSINSTEVVS